MNITPWKDLQRNALARISQANTALRFSKDSDAAGLCEAWRAWEAGTSSEFLNRLLFDCPGRSSATEIAVLEDWICFRDGASELDSSARALIEGRLELLRANHAIRVVIGGLVGQASTVAHGMRLGLRRITSIRSFLLTADIDPDRIGIAVRGSGWSVTEGGGGAEASPRPGSEWRLQVTDPRWTLARN
jgi:outer membrane protein OmpA-like peptidoglycan-associated protein